MDVLREPTPREAKHKFRDRVGTNCPVQLGTFVGQTNIGREAQCLERNPPMSTQPILDSRERANRRASGA